MRIKVRVRSKHIKNGIQHSSANCAIALALKEMFDSYVTVNSQVATLYNTNKPNKRIQRYKMSRRAGKFVMNFDSSKRSVRPSTFILTEQEYL